MKTKKRGTAASSRFSRGERVGTKSRRGARKIGGASHRRDEETARMGGPTA